MNKETVDYFNGDELAAQVYEAKYAAKEANGKVIEVNPDDCLMRLVNEFYRIESKYPNPLPGKAIEGMLRGFKHVVLGGSAMASLGLKKAVSASNCFVIASPKDSIESIYDSRKDQAQLMKRRGGVGKDLSNLRPRGTKVDNSAESSTGAASFMNVDSEVTREIAQEGRRGALMLSISIRHPDALEFIESKQDLSKITGANISVRVDAEFMSALETGRGYFQKWPIDADIDESRWELQMNTLTKVETTDGKEAYVKWVNASKLWDKLIHCAWNTAEPGILFWDKTINNGPDVVYPEFTPISTNPCGEIPMGAYDSCRLIHVNLASLVVNAFTPNAYIDYELAGDIFYNVVKLGDDLVDLELEAVQRIIDKTMANGNENSESALWEKIYNTTIQGRRCGIGFTALADMCAMLGVKYGSKESLEIIEELMDCKIQSEIKAQIDLARDRGAFPAMDIDKEFQCTFSGRIKAPMSPFYDFLLDNMTKDLSDRWIEHGHRNISWSTVAPTGSISMLTQTTSGIEPLFMPYYKRSKKVQRDEEYDFIDETGEKFKNYFVVHQGLKAFADKRGLPMNTMEEIQAAFEASPYFGATAEEVHYEDRLRVQALVQRYITHSISSTVNLPNDTTEQVVSRLYMLAYKANCKGITVYRDGCRNGILNKVTEVKKDNFPQYDAPKRPKILEARMHPVKVKGQTFAVFIGLLEGRPYEVFAITPLPPGLKKQSGSIVKVKKGQYRWIGEDGDTIDNIGIFNSEVQAVCTINASLALRHGVKIAYVIKSLKKSGTSLVSFSSAIARVLSQYVIDDSSEEGEICPECGKGKIVHEGGCAHCDSCEYSLCFFMREVE